MAVTTRVLDQRVSKRLTSLSLLLVLVLPSYKAPTSLLEPFIGFKRHSAVVDTSDQFGIKAVEEAFQVMNRCTLAIQGFRAPYEDSTLALQRAIAIRDYFIERGVADSSQFVLEDLGTLIKLNQREQVEMTKSRWLSRAVRHNWVVTFLILNYEEGE